MERKKNLNVALLCKPFQRFLLKQEKEEENQK